MPRRSKKAKVPGSVATEAAAAGVISAGGANTLETAIPANRSTTRKQLRGKAGGLRDMPHVPLDILIEIFSYMLPLDLLNLTRTSKSFRALLMNRSFAGVWKASRGLVEDLPDCPEYLSEPAYANLVFSDHCHNCMKPNVQGVIWQFLARYCRPCKKLLTVKTSDTHFCVEFLKKNIWEVRSIFNVLRNIYHVPQIQQVRQAWEELHDDTEKWSKYVHEQKERALAVYNLSDECRTWVEGEAAAKGYRREEVRERRLQFIVAKLREMGWGEEIDMLPEDLFPLSDHPQVRMAREISERTWEKIRDEIVSYMQHNKDLRVAEKRCAVLRVRLQTLELVTKSLRAEVGRHENTEFLPKFPDYALMPEFRALMEAPTEEMLNMQAFADVAVRLRELDRPWVVQREKCLARMLEKALGRLPEGADDELPANDDPNDMSYEIILKLAVSTLECQRCSERFHATDATLHRCTRGSGRSWLLDIQHETEGSYTYEVARISRSLRPWDMSCLRVPDLEPLRRVIQMAGKDPETVTEEEMNKLNVRVAVKGQLVDGKCKFMTWDAVRRTGHLDPAVCESG